ncbi:Glutathione synthase/RimK-type ligase, ATP-grasp superfamily [Burkholderia sp. D7]|nr:Glutathione synthase/RimK-type ligase, ATP-grasp superfamily [Burkholderia sp. D7]
MLACNRNVGRGRYAAKLALMKRPDAHGQAMMTRESDDTPKHPSAPVDRLSAIASPDPLVHRTLADACRRAGDELGALAHLIAAHTLDAYATGSPDARTNGLCDVATGYFMKGDHATATRWYELVLTLDPNVAVACQNLAAIHAGEGNTALAEVYRECAYGIQRVFVEETAGWTRSVLILCTGKSTGNVPFEALLPGARNRRIKYAIDYAADDEDAQLPSFDLVFNAIGDPDIAAPLGGRLARFEAQCSRPLLNPNDAIARTSRHKLPALLDGLDDVQTAPCVRYEGPSEGQSIEALASLLADHAVTFPLLARPVAAHGGDGLVLCDSIEALESRLSTQSGAQYLTAFRDCQSADGFYRKYRVIYVDREPLPYHLVISPHWIAHYFSADMESHAWKLAEELRFLQDPRAALGARAMNAITAIGQRLDLDYGGIDFTLLPDGQVFVFEANATMLAHYERGSGVLAHKNQHVQHIVDAFEHMLAHRTVG